MTNETTVTYFKKEKILFRVRMALEAREMALQPGNEVTHGYAYAAGYMASCLENIALMLEDA